jgi:hypothetical protein
MVTALVLAPVSTTHVVGLPLMLATTLQVEGLKAVGGRVLLKMVLGLVMEWRAAVAKLSTEPTGGLKVLSVSCTTVSTFAAISCPRATRLGTFAKWPARQVRIAWGGTVPSRTPSSLILLVISAAIFLAF